MKGTSMIPATHLLPQVSEDVCSDVMRRAQTSKNLVVWLQQMSRENPSLCDTMNGWARKQPNLVTALGGLAIMYELLRSQAEVDKKQ
jgi:hypothetical protein